MKFSTILTFAIATYTATTLASAQSFQQRNADEAEKLTEEFAKLTPNSPCTNGQQACVQDKFAQCVGGKFALTTCAGGLKCVVLPLVNKEGTSITCSTEEDRQKRLENARNAGKNPDPSKDPKEPPKDPKEPPKDPKEPPKDPKEPPKDPKEPPKDPKEPPKDPKELPKDPKELPKDPKEPLKDPKEPPKDPKEPPKENEPPKDPKEPPKENEPPKDPKGKENDNDMPPKKPKENDGEMPPKKPKENDGKKPKENDGKKPKENDGKNPKDNDPKNPGNDDDVPPEKPKGKEPQTPPPPAKKPDDELAAIRRQNADDAEALQESFKSLTPDSDCEQNQIACVNEQIAQCDNGKFALRECSQGLICTALPLVLKKGTTVTCTTAEDRDNRLNEARNNLRK